MNPFTINLDALEQMRNDPKNRKDRRKVLNKKKNKDVLEKIEKDFTEDLYDFQSELNSYKEPNSTQNKQQFLSNFCDLLKNHQFSSGKDPLEARIKSDHFSSDFMQFLDKYGIRFSDERCNEGNNFGINLSGTTNPFTKDCAKRTLEEMMKHDSKYNL